MTWQGRLLVGAWSTCAIVGVASLWAWSAAVPSVPPEVPETLPAPPAPTIRDTAAGVGAAATLRDRNPFRVERKPTTVRYSPWAPAEAAVPQPAPPPRPSPTLVGIVGGPPWHVLIQGIPGRERGFLLRVGQETNGIRLVELRGDTAVLAGPDTTWALTPRRPWQ